MFACSWPGIIRILPPNLDQKNDKSASVLGAAALLQIEKAALEGDAEEGAQGPHAALAVRLQQRDPDRKFSLGERLQYVLLIGE